MFFFTDDVVLQFFCSADSRYLLPLSIVSISFFYMKKEKFFEYLGWVGMCTAILMYVFYFPQIKQNLAGNKGSFIQPFMAGVNCTLWVCYGLFKEKRDLPVAIANAPGVIFGFLAAFTAL